MQKSQYIAQYFPQGAMQTALSSRNKALAGGFRKPPSCLLYNHFGKLSGGIYQSQNQTVSQRDCTSKSFYPVLTMLTVLSV